MPRSKAAQRSFSEAAASCPSVGDATRHVRVSAVVPVRNDNWRGNLNQRAELTLPAQVEAFDEVVVVDFNSVGRPPLLEALALDISVRNRIVSVVVNASWCSSLMGFACGNYFGETAARNVGLRAATGEFVVSTNIDDLPPHRALLHSLASRMGPEDGVLLPRVDIPLQAATALFGKTDANDALRQLQRRPLALGARSEKGCGYGAVDRFAFARSSWQGCQNLAHLRSLGSNPVYKEERSISRRPTKVFARAMLLVGCPGDFQMASQTLWRRASFDSINLVHHGFGDHTLVAHWLNANATVCAPCDATVVHVSHKKVPSGTQQNDDAWNRWRFDAMGRFLRHAKSNVSAPVPLELV